MILLADLVRILDGQFVQKINENPKNLSRHQRIRVRIRLIWGRGVDRGKNRPARFWLLEVVVLIGFFKKETQIRKKTAFKPPKGELSFF